MQIDLPLTEDDFKDAHVFFTTCEFMMNFLDNPQKVVGVLKNDFTPAELDKLRDALGPKENKSRIARLLQALK